MTSASTGRSLLRSVQECAYENGVTAHCLPATTFEWQEKAPEFVTEPLQFHNGTSWEIKLAAERFLSHVLPHGDANGDGVKDWDGWYTNAEGQITPGVGNPADNCHTKFNTLAVRCHDFDFDADGLTDRFQHSAGGLQVKSAASTVWINTGISSGIFSSGNAPMNTSVTCQLRRLTALPSTPLITG